MSEAPLRAQRKRQTSLSPVWIVPIVALLIGVWLVYDNLSSRGPQITLEIADAEGIVAGTTLVRLLNVEVGRVEQVSLSEDLSHTLVLARMSPDAERMLAEDSQFWVVKPRIGRDGISGLGTVLSGSYIQLQPGQSARSARRFTMLSQPPLTSGSGGLRINLVSDLGSSLRVGDPVSYQGFTVGRVEEASFDAASRQMQHRLFIESPYDALITENTRFWRASGIDLRLDSQGVRIGIDSLEALLVGGVTFGYLEDDPAGPRVDADSDFNLYPDQESAMQASFYQYLEYVLLVDNTVRGLAPGAPVEYRGIRVGTVASVPWNFSVPEPGAEQQFAIPVLVRIEPQRFDDDGADRDRGLEEWQSRFESLFAEGLRATLKAGNLLTGALFVDLNVQPELAGTYVADSFRTRPVLPSTSGGFAQIEAQLNALLDKLNSLQVEPVLEQIEQTLETAQQVLAELRGLGSSLEQFSADPVTRALPATLTATLQELRTAAQGFAPGSSTYEELNGSLQGLERLLRDLQPLVQALDEQPNALLFNRSPAEDPQPRARP